jgi:hypothetical protein
VPLDGVVVPDDGQAVMTDTTTRLITVSWNIAYGKNGLPRFSTSFL